MPRYMYIYIIYTLHYILFPKKINSETRSSMESNFPRHSPPAVICCLPVGLRWDSVRALQGCNRLNPKAMHTKLETTITPNPKPEALNR